MTLFLKVCKCKFRNGGHYDPEWAQVSSEYTDDQTNNLCKNARFLSYSSIFVVRVLFLGFVI